MLNSKCTIAKIYATETWINNQNKKLTNLIQISEQALQQISVLTTPNQVVMVVQENNKPDFIVDRNALALVLNDIQDPGNLGTIIRIADWFGIKNIICSEACANWKNPKVIQSSMGSFLRVNLYYKNLEEFFSKNDLPVYGALLQGKNIALVQPQKSGYLLVGNESKGIAENLLPFVTEPISIVKIGEAESLNAAVATGILLSHFK